MKTYIVEIHPFPHIMGRDEIVRIESDKDLDTVLQGLQDKLKEENSMFEYDLIGYTVEDFLNGIELVKIDI